jgi:sialate O-acetylesterase
MKLQLLVISAALAIGPVHADVRMPAIFGDHMVLQQSIKLPVWGKADPGEKITVAVGPRTGSTTAGPDGKWRVDLESLKGSTDPVTLTVTGNNTLTFSDVLLGDVWACSGQSNMEFGMNGTNRAKEDIPKANHPLLRLFIVNKAPSFDPQENFVPDNNPKNALIGRWQVCTPEMIVGHGGWPDGFSAVAYYFGVQIQSQTHLPVGLIQCPWGGMPIEAFTSLEALKAKPVLASYVEAHETELANSSVLQAAYPAAKAEYDPKLKVWNEQYGTAFKQAMEDWKKACEAASAAHAPAPPKPKPEVPTPVAPPDGKPTARTATHLFNGMISPLIPFGIKGVIWYQGEANRDKPWDYDTLFATLISDWRARWGQGDFPFLFVQLAAFQTPASQPVEKSGWAGIRDMQLRTLRLPNTGMAVAIDIGEARDIHPKNKFEVGRRLALAARRVAYGENLEFSGPIYEGMQVEGNKIRIRFHHAKGLKIAPHPQSDPAMSPESAPAELQAFAIAGSDQKWVPAKAAIDGETVVVTSDSVKEPVAVRYGWANNPPCFLYNGADLPASPFRTDDWPDPLQAQASSPAPSPAVQP